MKATEAQNGGWFEFGPFRLDLTTHELIREGQVVPLPTRKAFDTLLVLVRHRDRILRKEEMLEAVWPGTHVSDESLTQCISILRRALGDDSGHPQYIATVPRRGYRFIAPVVEHGTAESQPATTAEALELPGPATETVGVGQPARPAVAAERPEPASRWPGLTRRLALVTALAILLAVSALGYLAIARERTVASPPAIRLTEAAPEGTSFVSGAVLSPDGRRLVFAARDESSGVTRLWVRGLEEGNARAIPGTERAIRPFWSPDSRSIAFFSDGYLRRLDLPDREGVARPPEMLAPTGIGFGSATGTWSTSGQILFAPANGPIAMVAATGGAARPLTTLDASAGEVAHQFPQWLPDERRFLFEAISAISGSPERRTTYIGSLDSFERTQLFDDSIAPVFFAAPDQLLYVKDEVLMAQRFDVERLRLIGSPAPIATGATNPTHRNGATLSATEELLAFWGPAAQSVGWRSRDGSRLGQIAEPPHLYNTVMSPDQRQLVAEGGSPSSGIWLVDLERGARMNIAPRGTTPVWSPNGDQIAFGSEESIHVRGVGPRQGGERVLELQHSPSIHDWSRDGRYILYSSVGVKGSRDLWTVALETGEAVPYLQEAATEGQGRISPDGRWAAYTSDESGRWEVYVQSFPTPGAKSVISVGGGSEPQWRGDGRELFYISLDGRMMAVSVTPGTELLVSPPKLLFHAGLSGDIPMRRNRYAVRSDGERFLIEAASPPPGPPVTFVVNWRSLIPR